MPAGSVPCVAPNPQIVVGIGCLAPSRGPVCPVVALPVRVFADIPNEVVRWRGTGLRRSVAVQEPLIVRQLLARRRLWATFPR